MNPDPRLQEQRDAVLKAAIHHMNECGGGHGTQKCSVITVALAAYEAAALKLGAEDERQAWLGWTEGGK